MSPSSRPLDGRRIVVTRTREQASELSLRLSALGAEVIELPVIRIVKDVSREALADVMLEFGSYDWLVFTSANGVQHFFDEFRRIFDDIRALGLIRIACVGESTARAVSKLHLRVELLPKKATAEVLADELTATGSLDNSKILVITGSLNRDVLVKKLEKARAIVDQLQVYSTHKTDLKDHPAAGSFREKGADAVLFASSSSAQFFAEQSDVLRLSPGAIQPLNGSIGPQTSQAMKEAGIRVHFEAKTPGMEELVEALVEKLGKR